MTAETLPDRVLAPCDAHDEPGCPVCNRTTRRQTPRTGTPPTPPTSSPVWPPRSSGPLPPGWQGHYPDVNVVTCLDELDLWAAEYDRLVGTVVTSRKALARARHAYDLSCARQRRVAKATPETGRRTVADIDSEVVIATADEYQTFLDAEAEADAARTLMFAAKDQLMRLQQHVSAAKVMTPGGGL